MATCTGNKKSAIFLRSSELGMQESTKEVIIPMGSPKTPIPFSGNKIEWILKEKLSHGCDVEKKRTGTIIYQLIFWIYNKNI